MAELKPTRHYRRPVSVTDIPGAQQARFDETHQLDFMQLQEFPITDPWEQLFQSVIREEAHHFADAVVLEGGIGVGSLMIGAVHSTFDKGHLPPRHIIGVDNNIHALDLAHHNLGQLGYADQHENYELWHGRIIGFLQMHDRIPANVGVFCLPQVPRQKVSDLTGSDGYDADDIPQAVEKHHETGLALIGGTLLELHGRVPDDFIAYVPFTGRIPSRAIAEMLHETGWEVIRDFTSPQLIQQDPDTKLDPFIGVSDRDGQNHFWELKNDSFHPISVAEAAKRVNESKGDRNNCNVYHELSIFKLKKKPIQHYVN